MAGMRNTYDSLDRIMIAILIAALLLPLAALAA
jgi:hypothetical protein